MTTPIERYDELRHRLVSPHREAEQTTTPIEKYEALRHRRDGARRDAERFRRISNEAKSDYGRMTIGGSAVPTNIVERIGTALGEWADDEEKVVVDLNQQMADLFKPTRGEEVSETAPSVLGTR